MALTKIACPECGAGLKSSAGFAAGEEVECPKCESSFTVEDPADDEAADEAPKKKKKKKARSDEEKSYKSSPMRFAVLGVLVTVMLVLGGMLLLKMRRDKQTEEENAKITARNNEDPPPGNPNGGPPPLVAGPGIGVGGPPKKGGGAVVPPLPPPPLLPNGQLPKTNGPAPNIPMQPPPTGGSPFPFLGGSPASNTAEGKQLMASLRQKVIGSWEGTAPDGTVHKVSYQANGQFTHDAGGKSTAGTWQASGLVGDKVLKITRGTTVLKVAFEGSDEIVHDTETAGVSLVLKKK